MSTNLALDLELLVETNTTNVYTNGDAKSLFLTTNTGEIITVPLKLFLAFRNTFRICGCCPDNKKNLFRKLNPHEYNIEHNNGESLYIWDKYVAKLSDDTHLITVSVLSNSSYIVDNTEVEIDPCHVDTIICEAFEKVRAMYE